RGYLEPEASLRKSGPRRNEPRALDPRRPRGRSSTPGRAEIPNAMSHGVGAVETPQHRGQLHTRQQAAMSHRLWTRGDRTVEGTPPIRPNGRGFRAANSPVRPPRLLFSSQGSNLASDLQ